MIQPHIDYGCTIYRNCSKDLLRKIHRIQKQFGRAILDINKPRDIHITDLFKKLDWIPLDERIKYFKCTQVFKILTHDCPNYLTSHFSKFKDNHSHTITRQTELDLRPPSFKHGSGFRTFKYQGAILWNNLPDAMKKIKSIEIFKNTYMDYIKKDIYNTQSFWLDN